MYNGCEVIDTEIVLCWVLGQEESVAIEFFTTVYEKIKTDKKKAERATDPKRYTYFFR